MILLGMLFREMGCINLMSDGFLLLYMAFGLACLTSIALAYIWWLDRQEQRIMEMETDEDEVLTQDEE